MAKNGYNNRAEFDALLKGTEVQDELKKLTDRAAASAGKGFVTDVGVGRTRALARVFPTTRGAFFRERRDHVLMRAQDAMRGDS